MIYRPNRNKREGIIAPLFAFILPVLLIFSAFAINLSYMQLTTTQLKIATDASSHAGGRALTFFQDTDLAIVEMDRFARLNRVAGHEVVIPQDDDHMQFGQAVLANGKYEFTQHSKSAADSDDNAVIVNSVRVFAEVDTPMAFRFQSGNTTFNPTRSSITHQRDRDISMVVDRSGSMLEYTNIPVLDLALQERLDSNQISRDEYNLATGFIHVDPRSPRVYAQYFTNNTINELNQLVTLLDRNDNPLASQVRHAVEYAESFQRNLEGPKFATRISSNTSLQAPVFAGQSEISEGRKWRNRFQNGMADAAAEHSRWQALSEAMDSFFTVLEQTDQDEKVALVVFSSDAEAESVLTSDYDLLRQIVADIVPLGGTEIGDGLNKGLREVTNFNGSGDPPDARRFAEKMIVVMTDGNSNGRGLDAVSVATDFKSQHPEAIIHTVTFGEGAAQGPMVGVAEVAGGNHYHANDADELAAEFREIANIPPTIFTF